MKNDTALQMQKNMNRGIGVPNALLRIGKVITTMEAPTQLASVENGIRWGYRI